VLVHEQDGLAPCIAFGKRTTLLIIHSQKDKMIGLKGEVEALGPTCLREDYSDQGDIVPKFSAP
jgi:hypothetical protein